MTFRLYLVAGQHYPELETIARAHRLGSPFKEFAEELTDAALFDSDPVTMTPCWPDRPRTLISYAYVSDAHMAIVRKHNMDLVIDSGAFTTSTCGGEVDHDAYLEWLLEHRADITFALSLDVIGDHHASRTNHDYAKSHIGDAVPLVPTFHLGSPLTELERLCKENSLVSIGGAVPFARHARLLVTTMRRLHRIATEHGTMLHGLGMTGNNVVHAMPWSSVDSSAWLSGARYPSLHLANVDGRLWTLEHGNRLTRREALILTHYDGDPALVSSPGWSLSNNVGKAVALERREWITSASARAFMYLEAYKNRARKVAPTPTLP